MAKQRIGIAYAFLDYEGNEGELMSALRECRRRANFAESLTFSVLDDRKSKDFDHERKLVPESIASAARETKVYGITPIHALREGLDKPKPVENLRYVIRAEDGDVNHPEYAEPLSQAKANEVTAGMLKHVAREAGLAEIREDNRQFVRVAVFYEDHRKRAVRYD